MLDDYIVIFGGIWDVTKELNDLHLYSVTQNEWLILHDSSNSPLKSPGGVKKFGNGQMRGAGHSPISPVRGNDASIDSPNKLNRSITKQTKNT